MPTGQEHRHFGGSNGLRSLPAVGVRLYACLIMNLAERRAMWREHRHLRQLWRVRLVAALVAVVLSVWGGWFGGGGWMLPAALVLLFLIIFPLWFSDRRAEAEWKARRAARDAARSRRA
jgi:fatty acid desaturase